MQEFGQEICKKSIKKITPRNGSIVIAAVDGELTMKRLSIEEDSMQLLPENPNYKPINITPDQHVVIWGLSPLLSPGLVINR